MAGRAKGTDLASPGLELFALKSDRTLLNAAGEVRGVGGFECVFLVWGGYV